MRATARNTFCGVIGLLWSFSTNAHFLASSSRQLRYLVNISTLTSDNSTTIEDSNSSKPLLNESTSIICPAYYTEENDIVLQNNVITRLQSMSKGNLAISAIKLFRRKNEKFYQTVLNNVIMATCDVEANGTTDRCVEMDSSEAIKDSNGTCLEEASDFSCPIGYCERYSNCYWKPIVPGQPRETRFPLEEYGNARSGLLGRSKESYIGDLLYPGVIGIIVALVLLLIWMLFLMARCCCCCLWTNIFHLCSPIPREKRYNTCFELVTPMLVYALCVAVFVFCGIASYIGNLDITTAENGLFRHSSALLQDAKLSFTRSQTQLLNLDNVAFEATSQTIGIFNGTEFVRKDATEIESSFTDYESIYDQGIELSNTTMLHTAVLGFLEKVGPVVDSIESVIHTLEADIYEKIDSIESSIGLAIDQLNLLVNQTTGFESQLSSVQLIDSSYRPTRQAALLVIFCLGFIFAFAGFLGLLSGLSKDFICGVPCITHAAWILCAILGSVAVIFGSALLVINFALLDACEMADIVTNDFEPYLGEVLAKGPNACFNDTNLLDALELSDMLNFPVKLDSFLTTLDTINMTEEFTSVTAPLQEFDVAITGTISSSALALLNDMTKWNNGACPFNDTYTSSNAQTPWIANNGKVTTNYLLNSTGDLGNYHRASGSESGRNYMKRIYDIAGQCVQNTVLPSSSSSRSCCLQNSTTTDCDLQEGDWCTIGSDCRNVCGNLTMAIEEAYLAVLNSERTEANMRADLGIFCPVGYNCPTAEFQNLGHKSTIEDLVDTFRVNLTQVSEELVNATSRSIGEGKAAVEDLMCNMNFSFVESRYDQIHKDICETFLGGIAQVTWVMWLLALVLEIVAIIGCIIVVRMKWSGEDAEFGFFKSNGKVRVRL